MSERPRAPRELPPDPYAPPASGTTPRVARALARARADARAFERDPRGALAALDTVRAPGAAPADDPAVMPATPTASAAPTRSVAVGDPQAPLARFLEVLDRHGLLGEDGRIAPGAHLVSMGDHFDWGQPEERAFAAESAFALLAWLAANPPARVSILLGNHDLARVGELAPFDDATFAGAREEALALRAIPVHEPGRAERRQAFLARYPSLPGVGVTARDFATFEARQRRLVEALVDAGRMAPAIAFDDDLLLIHSPVTARDLDLLGLDGAPGDATARAVAGALDAAFRRAWSAWDRRNPFGLGSLYRPGHSGHGEAKGVFVQRPADPVHGDPAQFAGLPRRRFHPDELPHGLTQVVGHIRDNKCRELMPSWIAGAPAHDGPIRHLRANGSRIAYARGAPSAEALEAARRGREALLVFADGGMNHAAPARYEAFDLRARAALAPAR